VCDHHCDVSSSLSSILIGVCVCVCVCVCVILSTSCPAVNYRVIGPLKQISDWIAVISLSDVNSKRYCMKGKSNSYNLKLNVSITVRR
jgi:hypothetical protein